MKHINAQRIVSTAVTRTTTNLLSRWLTKLMTPKLAPMKKVALAPAVVAAPRPLQPPRNFYVATARGFLVIQIHNANPVITFTPDMRCATPFASFGQSNRAAKSAVAALPRDQQYYGIVRPVISGV